MHRAALAAAGLEDWSYQRLPVPPELFAETARALGAAGFRGANVTIPHKEAALAVADDATDAARAIGAANTLTFADGTVHADNTDAAGLIAALGRDTRGMSALVLGAGGAGRAAAWALREAGAGVSVWNRTTERAEALAADLGVASVEAPVGAELVVNATSVGLRPGDPIEDLPVAWIDPPRLAVELVYGEHETPFSAWAQSVGAPLVDGLEVLVRQGALSFERWTGAEAPLDAMRAAARAA